MATAPANLDQTRRRAREVGGDLRDRLESLEPVVRDRWEDLEPALRQRWEDLEPVVRERWDEFEPVLRQRLDDLEPAVRQAQVGLWRALRALFTGLAVLPATLIRVIKVLAGVADEATERGQQAGQEALKRRRRRQGIHLRRRTLVAYVAGGVGVGFVIGWVLGRQRTRDELELEDAPFEASGPVGNGATRSDASLTE